MRLKNKNESPPGGWWWKAPDGKVIVPKGGGLDELVKSAFNWMTARGIEVPVNLYQVIEDAICMRISPKLCRYNGIGDRISQAIHAGAALVDKVAGTKLEKRARGCGGCAKRRMRLNRLNK